MRVSRGTTPLAVGDPPSTWIRSSRMRFAKAWGIDGPSRRRPLRDYSVVVGGGASTPRKTPKYYGRPHRAAPTEFPPYVGETPVIRESVRLACGYVHPFLLRSSARFATAQRCGGGERVLRRPTKDGNLNPRVRLCSSAPLAILRMLCHRTEVRWRGSDSRSESAKKKEAHMCFLLFW